VLAAALKTKGWTVFFDRTIPPGKTWRQFIGKEINECRCMVVAWSTHSVKSHWVCEEADDGLKREILVPILLDQVTQPLGFGSIQVANLVGWKGNTESSNYLALCNALTERIGQGKLSAASGADKASRKPKIPWSKLFTVKVDKITVIAAIFAILLWFLIPVLFSQKEIAIINQAPSVGYDIIFNQLRIKQPEIKASNTNVNIFNQFLNQEPEILKIPGGSFQMGSNDGYDDEKPVHKVIMKSFAIGRYEVTFDEYEQFAEALGKPKPDDNGWGRGHRPAINVSWEDAEAYAHWLSSQTGKKFRLPTEAEWEYAARSGTVTDYYWLNQGQAKDFAWFKNFAWFAENSEDKTHPVGQKERNAFGLYDMSGNVWEWVEDCWHENYDQAPDDGSVWQEQNKGDCSLRVLRGGSWLDGSGWMRSAYRLGYAPAYRSNFIGFRLAQD